MKYELPPNEKRPRAANVLLEVVKRLPTDEWWVAELKRKRKRRTTDQNAKFHAMCQELGEAVGYTCEELKRLVKKEIGACQIVDGPMGKVWRFESSADWDRQRMAEAIELLYRWAIDADHVWRVE